MVLKMDCFEGFSTDLCPLILWLTSSFAVSYANVATYEFKKVTRVRIPLPPPPRPNCREIPPVLTTKYAKHARISRYFLHKPDCRERTGRPRMRYFPGFSPGLTCAVRFQGGH